MESSYNTFANSDSSANDHHHHHNSDTGTRKGSSATRKATVRDFLTVMALSLHAVFEGLAVGLESDVSKMWTLFAGYFQSLSQTQIKMLIKYLSPISHAAVSLHKYVLSFCVGLELWTSGKNTFAINLSYILVYAIMSPIGIAIGGCS